MLWIVLLLLGAPAVLLLVGWIGLRVKPEEFPAYPEQTPPLDTVPLPDDLPEPVTRFYRTITGGDTVPVIESAVLTGPARLSLAGITFNSRYRFTHEAGYNYRRYIEATLFGYPVMKVNEAYLDGHGRMELPFGTEEGMEIDQGANLALWGEAVWFPTLWITDPRARWEAVDANTARLIVPFGAEEETFTVTFDPETGLLATMEAMRYKGAGSEKVGWLVEGGDWREFHGLLIPTRGLVTWADEGTPWATFTLEDVAYNVDVSEYVRARGL
ncbi:MAG: hypothetical protein GXY36_19215 [Chloroflexi bacterium]|nr:hypothetical protein [Chloroflexota bacterium]